MASQEGVAKFNENLRRKVPPEEERTIIDAKGYEELR